MGCTLSQQALGVTSPEQVPLTVGDEGAFSQPNSPTKEGNDAHYSTESRRESSDAHPPAEQIQDDLVPQQTGDLNLGTSGSNIAPSDTCNGGSPFSIALLCKSPVEVRSGRQQIGTSDLCNSMNSMGQEQYAPTSTFSRDQITPDSSIVQPYQEFCPEIECLSANCNNSTTFSLPRSVGMWPQDFTPDAKNTNQSNGRLAAFFKCLQNGSLEKLPILIGSPDSVKVYHSCSPGLPTKQSQLPTVLEE